MVAVAENGGGGGCGIEMSDRFCRSVGGGWEELWAGSRVIRGLMDGRIAVIAEAVAKITPHEKTNRGNGSGNVELRHDADGGRCVGEGGEVGAGHGAWRAAVALAGE